MLTNLVKTFLMLGTRNERIMSKDLDPMEAIDQGGYNAPNPEEITGPEPAGLFCAIQRHQSTGL